MITGAASGIGLAAARRFAEMGLRVCLADLGGDALDAAKTAVAASANADVLAVATDVSDADDVQNLKNEVYDRFGEVAVLMNNAGTAAVALWTPHT